MLGNSAMDAKNLASSGSQVGRFDSNARIGRERGLSLEDIALEEEMHPAINEDDITIRRTNGSELMENSDNGGGTLIPGLSDDIAVLCLIRVARECVPVLCKVCKGWKRLVENEEYPLLRKQVGSSEGWIHVLPEIPVAGSFEAFSPQSNNWHKLPLIPGWSSDDCWQGFACVALGHRLLFMGGVRRSINAITQHFTSAEVSADVKVYNACTNQWSTARRMNTPRSWFAASVIGDLVYVAGGQGNIHFLDTAEVYDSKNDVWQSISNMNCVRSSCLGVTLNNQFWVIGGEYARHQYGIEPSKGSAEVYDPSTRMWVLVPEMGLDTHKVPWPSTIHNGRLLSVRHNKIMEYDEKENNWMHIGNVLGWDGYGKPSCRTRYGFAFESLGNEIYIIGGTQVSWLNFLKRSIQDTNTVEISSLEGQGISKILPWWNGADMDNTGGIILASVVMYL